MGVLPKSGALSANMINLAMNISGTTEFNIDDAALEWFDMADMFGGTWYGDKARPQYIDEWYEGEWVLCFIAGTQITMGDGTFKNIEDIAVEDEVMAYNPRKELFAPKRVTSIKTVENDGTPLQETIIIDFKDGTQLHCTDSNPFRVPGKYWCSYNPPKCMDDHEIPTNQLEVGDQCVNGEGTTTEITNITVVKTPVTTYSMTVSLWSTFIANGIVSHNKCIDGEALVTMSDGKTKALKDIAKGDKVLAYDADKDTFEADTVLEVQKIVHKGIYEYSLAGAKTIKATAGHPFLLSNMTFGALDPGSASTDYNLSCSTLNRKVNPVVYSEGMAVATKFLQTRLQGSRDDHKFEPQLQIDTYIIKLTNNNTFIVNDILMFTGINSK